MDGTESVAWKKQQINYDIEEVRKIGGVDAPNKFDVYIGR